MKYVIGIDEAGRGAWAGPFVAAAVCFAGDIPKGLGDSKALSAKAREALYQKLEESKPYKAVVFVEPKDVDKYGLTWAQTHAMGLALQQVLEQLHPGVKDKVQIILDGSINYLKGTDGTEAIPRADSAYVEVMAASILAKVERDREMRKLDALHKNYGFGGHMGYGTVVHLAAIKKHGVLAAHRKSYKPVKDSM